MISRSKETESIELFRNGFNCAQAVVSAYPESLGFDIELAQGLACGFGAGMGRQQKTCGAVSGAYMVLGIYCSKRYNEIKERKQESYKLVRLFTESFIEKYSTSDCASLLNCDLNTPEGQAYFKSANLGKKVCENCILDSIKIIDNLIKERV